MKKCETCGCPLEASHHHRVCPRCLLREAVQAGGEPDAGGFPSDDFFARYELLEQVGRGGQGDIWKVWDLEFRRPVAMKRLGKEWLTSEPARYRFLAEAQISSQLEHPGILPVYDVGLDPDGRPYYTTQLLPGTTFGHIWERVHDARQPEWTVPRAVELLRHVCDVMAHAHSRGVIHRDLKPDNILVGAFGDVRVIDWGSAHVLEGSRRNIQESLVPLNRQVVQTDRGELLWAEPGSALATGQSGLPMTVLFMPPEILRGETDRLGPRTDIYAMGVMLYGLLTGQLPYVLAGESLPPPNELRGRILGGPPPPVRQLSPAASRDLAAICGQAMAYDFADRYASMTELAEDLQAVLEIRPVRARQPGPWMTLQKWARRNISLVLLGSFSVAFIAVALAVTLGFKAERDSARQIQALRSAELAARSGHWQDALGDWEAARTDGYHDDIYLDLHEAEAWTILTEPVRSGALLTRLANRSDLGDQRGVVLLRLGEHELFDRRQAGHGIQLVRDAMTAGLTNADRLFAQGLLADSTPAALALFQQALLYDPYHHGAHLHSLSLEFLLGHHQELAHHLQIFKLLYPDDPSPAFIAAAEAALAGDPARSQAELAGLRRQVSAEVWTQADQTCRAYAAAAKYYDVDALLQTQPPGRTPLDRLRTDPFSAGAMLMPGDFTAITNRSGRLRTPHLPCLEQGLLAAADGLHRLVLPYLSNPAIGCQEIESGWQHHPEALAPALGGMLLENQEPPTGPPASAVLQQQATLYQLAAGSPSMIPALGRLARYLAARTEFELATRPSTAGASARTNCLAHIRQALATGETSAVEAHAYVRFALTLGDFDLGRELVLLEESRQPGLLSTRHDRIEVELAAGAFGPALHWIDQILASNPADPWAREHRQSALAQLDQLSRSPEISIPRQP